MSRPGRRVAIGAVCAVLLTVAACGDDDDDAAPDTTAAATATTGATEITAATETTGATETTAATETTGAPDTTGAPETTLDPVMELLGPEDLASGEPVKIGFVGDGASPAIDNTDEIRGAQMTVEFLNEHRGGIAGRPIELVTCETLQDPAVATDCANQFVEQGVVAVTLSQSAVAGAVWEPLHAAGVPTFWLQSSEQGPMTDTQSSFVLYNPLATYFGLPIAIAEEVGTDKIAFLIIDVPAAKGVIEGPAAPAILGAAGLEYEVIYAPVGTADMTTQVQQIMAGGAGMVHVTGNDAFCIAAMQAMQNLGYEGGLTTNSQCITDATRQGAPAEVLEGTGITATLALGAEGDPTWEMYQAVLETYGQDVQDPTNFLGLGGYAIVAALQAALDGIEGDVTQQTVVEAMKAMDETEIPGGAGMTFQCGGSASADLPGVCTNQSLVTRLDAQGQPTEYEVADPTQ